MGRDAGSGSTTVPVVRIRLSISLVSSARDACATLRAGKARHHALECGATGQCALGCHRFGGVRVLTPVFKDFDRRFTDQIPLLFGTGVLLYLLSVALHYALLALEVLREAEKREAEARILARDAELSALNSVDAARAREMCILLSEFLRSTLGLGEKALVPLEEEMALIRSFLAVEKVRFGSRLTVEEHIEDQCNTMLVPPLLLQPLVENAITHGIANRLEGGSIRLEARRAGDMLVILIENSFDPDSVSSRRNGLGLANVRKRLDVRYGVDARLEQRAAGERYSVELSLPAETQVVEA